MRNRIEELRTARGWSMRELASRANSSPSTINSLEKGKVQLTVQWVERLAKVFEVSPTEILGIDAQSPTEFHEDAALYEAEAGDLWRPKLGDSQFVYDVKTGVLDQLGIFPGSKLVVDMSARAVAACGTGDVVIAQLYDGMSAVTLLRQFVAPSLLITNSHAPNLPTINTRTDDAAIKGVVVSSHSEFRQMRGAAE